jgi:uncharacterized protein
MRIIHWIALILVIIGALNWGMIGFFHFDVISSLIGRSSTFALRAVFALIGLAGLWCFSFFKILASIELKKK